MPSLTPHSRWIVTALAFVALALGVAACALGIDEADIGKNCQAGFTFCDGKCVDLDVDAENCGSCGAVCAGVCRAGACGSGAGDGCAVSESVCDGACTNVNRDPDNCGECGNACGADDVCNQGACESACSGGLEACNRTCVDTDSDVSNCGTCGNSCNDGQVCSGGSCSSDCTGSETNCNGSCVNLSTSGENCGACGRACTGGEVCAAGSCTGSCPAGLTECTGACTNTTFDPNNCGKCGEKCAVGDICTAGTCVSICPAGLSVCGSQCRNLQTDVLACGDCDTTCAADEICRAGGCVGAANGYAVTDPWGEVFDGIPRGAKSFEDAKTDCERKGGRLPTPTELFRNNVVNGSGALSTPQDTTELWTLAPAQPNTDAMGAFVEQRITIRLDQGATGSSNPAGTNVRLATSTRNYRCVWPDAERDSFSGDNCNGEPGKECDDFGIWWSIDAMDRAPLPYAAAAWECNFYGASLTTARDLQEYAQAGMANATGRWLKASNFIRSSSGIYSMVLMRAFDGAPDSEPDHGFWRNGLSGDDSYQPGSFTSTTTEYQFRCIGKRAGITGKVPASPSCEGSCFTLSKRRATLITDTENRDETSFVEAIKACQNLGGSLPTVAEAFELMAAGLENADGTPIWTTDAVSFAVDSASIPPASWGNNRGYYTVVWDGVGNDQLFPYSSTATEPPHPVTLGIADQSGAPKREFRCVWRETFKAPAESPACAGSQYPTWDGTSLSCADPVDGDSDGNGNSGERADAYGNQWDGIARAPRTWEEARDECATDGGRLPTATEIYRARDGEPSAVSNSADLLWTLNPAPRISSGDELERITVQFGPDTSGGSNPAGYATQKPEGGTAPFRCIWPTQTVLFGGRACNGPADAPCFVPPGTAAGEKRLVTDAVHRVAIPQPSAAWECAFYNGRLPTHDQLLTLIHGGAPNGETGASRAIWLADPSYVHTGDADTASFERAYATAIWDGTGPDTWTYATGSAAAATAYRPFRCVFSDEL